MLTEIVAAIIGFAGAIIAALITVCYKNKSLRNIDVRFMRENENFKEVIETVNSIYMYTVNSYELLNRFNNLFEQDPKLTVNNIVILVRKKPNETEEDIKVLNTVISMWGRWHRKERIRNLKIVSYDHDPEHYYTVFGEKLMFCGQVYFDELKPTGTTVDYLPLVFENNSSLGQEVISKYHKHFENTLNKYKNNVLYE